MFSGIIKWIARVNEINQETDGILVTIKKPKLLQCRIGDSICINGVCSTVEKVNAKQFSVHYMPETLKLTTFAKLTSNDKVNLEDSLKLNDILSGHLVTGHVDCMGKIKKICLSPLMFVIAYPEKFSKFIIEKGSICTNGISLTCYNVKNNNFTVSLIPHTFKNTNLHFLKVGDNVNLEFDIIGKYVKKNTRIKSK
ncbi:MAG: riboflavin synthase [Patescibacteria group bacterium]